jgi:hypothetical protein
MLFAKQSEYGTLVFDKREQIMNWEAAGAIGDFIQSL